MESKLIYNDSDGKYYVYHGEDYVSDEEDLTDALIWFLSCVSLNVRAKWVDDNTLHQFYGKRKIVKAEIPQMD